jgi:hypothetical protein
MTKKSAVIDALRIAESMLTVIEKGGTFSTAVWYERMAIIRRILKETRT